MIYLDTHVVIWLYQKDEKLFTPETHELINREELFISPMVELELEYLFEAGKIKIRALPILSFLGDRIGLKKCETSFTEIIKKALEYKWTRDPFDRIITAQAAIDDSVLLTKDKIIRKNYPKAMW